jgi:diaminohydroxyphosphoribosylaminopyrimidine deaminase/5-amino-6-(5-phosphoribosylamino)uracil reductase
LAIFANSLMPDMDERYMQRCIELALQGIGYVAPNPIVGALLVYGDRVIAEGYHRKYGQAHAEVNCFDNVLEADQALVADATLYVSLEPCAHFGKTPPCTDLIIRKQVRKVVIGCRDSFEQVNGKGIEKLAEAGITVVTGVLEKECIELNKRFFTFHIKHRPYIILKWAQTANGKIANGSLVTGSRLPVTRLLITNEQTNRLVHKWRGEEAAILVGANTALLDNPSLNNRLWTGNSPVRMVLDPSLRATGNLKLYDQQHPTIIFNCQKNEEKDALVYYQIDRDKDAIAQILSACYQKQLQSVIVEGGAGLLRSFISYGVWDEARVITNNALEVAEGLDAPILPSQIPVTSDKIVNDTVNYYINK